MKVDEFLVERWMNLYEHDVEINIAETCVEPFTLREFLALTRCEGFFDEIMDVQLTYGYIEGRPDLREGIARLYEDMEPENILVMGGAIEANFNVFYSFVEPGDNIISIFPSYQQLYSVAKSFGANIKRLKLEPTNNWLPDIDELMGLIDDNTRMIVINNPHNPTGSLIDEPHLRAICEIAEDNGVYLLSDEAYRGLYINPGDYVPSAVDLSENAIATGSFSKTISLTGLRLGWISADREIIKECMLHRDYTTISKSIVDEALATIAVQSIDRIMERNLRIVRRNHRFLSEWIENNPLIDWVPPQAGSVAFMRHHLAVSSQELCIKLIKEKNTFLVPSECFEIEGYLRIGFGNRFEILEEGLMRFKKLLEDFPI